MTTDARGQISTVNDEVDTATYASPLSIENEGTDVGLLVQAVLYYLIGSLGFTGNLLVIIVIFQYTKMRRSLTNFYVINQSLIDGLAGLMLILSRVWQYDGRPLHGIAGVVYCKLWVPRIIVWALAISSTFNLMALTIERYLAVVHPMWHRVSFTTPKIVLSMIGIWMIGLVIQMSYKVPSGGLAPDGRCVVLGFFPTPEAKQAVGSIIIIIQFFLPLTLMTFCYIRMFMVLKVNKIQPIQPQTSKNAGGKDDVDRNTRARRNILKTLTIVTACFAFCWMWNQFYFLLSNLGLRSMHYANPFVTFSLFCVYINTCINPIIYIIHYDQFRRGLRILGNRMRRGREVGPDISASVGTATKMGAESTVTTKFQRESHN